MDGELTGAGIATAAILVITAVAKIINEWRKDRHAEDKEKHGAELAKMPAVRALVETVLAHLVTAKGAAESDQGLAVLNLTVVGKPAPPKK